jgi:hypothetical protein
VVGVTPQGTPNLLDKWTIEKPDLGRSVAVRLAPQPYGSKSNAVTVSNNSSYALNGAQLVLRDCDYDGPVDDTHTVAGKNVVITLGRIAPGATISVTVSVCSGDLDGELRSSTAQPVKLPSDDGR